MEPRLTSKLALILVALSFVALPAFSSVQATDQFSSTIIKGFAQWNASRIENIVLSNGLKQAANINEVERFFPLTSNSIKTYKFLSAKALLPLVQDSIQTDIQAFSKFFGECVPEEIKTIANIDDDKDSKWKDLRAKLTSFINGKNPDNLLLKTTDSTCPNLVVSSKEKKAVVKMEQTYLSTPPDPEMLPKGTDTNFRTTSIALRDFREYLKVPDDMQITKPKDLTSEVNFALILDQLLFLETLKDQSLSYTTRVHHLLSGIDRIAEFSTKKDYPAYAKFQRIGLFFAALADAGEAKSPEAVVSALDTYVDAQGAYNDKRLPGGVYANYYVPISTAPSEPVESLPFENWTVGWDLYISSYYGPSAHRLIAEETDIRFFGPVGLELKLAKFRTPRNWAVHTGGALGFNYAPVDIGSYITNELSDDDYNASFDDILAPSYFLSYSFDNAPVALLSGYQTNITISENKETNGWFFAITFDLPVLKIF